MSFLPVNGASVFLSLTLQFFPMYVDIKLPTKTYPSSMENILVGKNVIRHSYYRSIQIILQNT